MTVASPLPPPPLAAADIAVFLDVDGTLLEIAERPDAVRVPLWMRRLLASLGNATEGALALVSGRPIVQLDALFAPLQLSAAGLHGLERRNLPQPVVRAAPDPALLADALARLVAFTVAHPGTLVEDKGLTLALHYRNAPWHRAAAAAAVDGVVAASRGALVVLAGKMVFELKPPGHDKGGAIAAFMQEPPFLGRCPVFAGDDVTDEAGFTIVNQLNGVSIRIGADQHATTASYGHADVKALRRWLLGLLPGRPARRS